MASWTLVDVPDSSTEYVGEILEDAAKLAKDNLSGEASRINDVADAAKDVALLQIAQAAGG